MSKPKKQDRRTFKRARTPAPKRKARQPRRVFCHDCKGEVSNEPILCEDCVSRRNEEGMSREDPRTIQTWRRT